MIKITHKVVYLQFNTGFSIQQNQLCYAGKSPTGKWSVMWDAPGNSHPCGRANSASVSKLVNFHSTLLIYCSFNVAGWWGWFTNFFFATPCKHHHIQVLGWEWCNPRYGDVCTPFLFWVVLDGFLVVIFETYAFIQ